MHEAGQGASLLHQHLSQGYLPARCGSNFVVELSVLPFAHVQPFRTAAAWLPRAVAGLLGLVVTRWTLPEIDNRVSVERCALWWL